MLIMLLIMSRKEKKTEDLVTFVKPLHLSLIEKNFPVVHVLPKDSCGNRVPASTPSVFAASSWKVCILNGY